MKSHLIDEKLVKEKPEFLLKFQNTKINFLIEKTFVTGFVPEEFNENFYKDKTLIEFEIDKNNIVEDLKSFIKNYFYSSKQLYIVFTKKINWEEISLTEKIELNAKNFDIHFLDNKVQILLLIDKANFK
ncbi:hypothetical protein FSBG_00132 [Fusobacterium gonidiaformans 3-1-5R]|uniref:Uncharacterized protein n=1 Tax=Fusobacterium gonidiaformans 3-1-5R TaxID=469605 RepID=E5BEV4_9FUSO|nr:hypothetical protein [Fusobacterium gonidiaformans]EFS20635.1 hypothetical protein FSBG_00132 [Fusobacterium gonidiaformans 3-1-5R]